MICQRLTCAPKLSRKLLAFETRCYGRLFAGMVRVWVAGKTVCGWQVKLCDPLVTHGPYLSALEISVI